MTNEASFCTHHSCFHPSTLLCIAPDLIQGVFLPNTVNKMSHQLAADLEKGSYSETELVGSITDICNVLVRLGHFEEDDNI